MKNFILISFFLLNFYILPSSISYADEWSKFSCRTSCSIDTCGHPDYKHEWKRNNNTYSYRENVPGFDPFSGTANIINETNESLNLRILIYPDDGSVYVYNHELDKITGRMTIITENAKYSFYDINYDDTFCEAKGIVALKEKEITRKEKISIFKKDCQELGFTDGTDGMGNCVLKLMELENNSSPQVVTTNERPSNDNAMLEIERAKLKAEQERLEVEKQRAWIERQEQLNRIGTQSIDQGWCLMNGGGWGC